MESSIISRFFDYVEVRTKITSLFAFLLGLAYLFYLGQPINGRNTLIFFLAMFLFDLTTTAINNYIDTKTNGLPLQFSRKVGFTIILLLLIMSVALGLLLVYYTDIIVLLLGGACFICGVLYTYGPIPISRQPLGEILSGIFFGFFIPLILLYINLPKDWFFIYSFNFEVLSFQLYVKPIIHFLFLTIAPICTTANIMLANNTCDLEKDITVKRYTLPYYIGVHSALNLFAALYYAVYIAAIVMVTARIVPASYLGILLTIIPVQKNINIFREKQVKSQTFVSAIKNYIWIMGADVFFLFLCGWVSR